MRLCPKCGKKSQEARCPDDGTATLVLAQNPDSKLSEGTEVNGRYRIGRMIGQGGFGAVYRAKNLATDQDIAIKLLAVSLESDDSDMIQRFFAEAQVTASLKHPNTIRVFDFGQTEGGALYIAMELLSGRPLNEELRERVASQHYFEEQDIITIGAQILRSLAEAHSANLVHRDLKPHNIFLHEVEGDDPVVKVLDFGIAKRLGSNLTGTGKAFGTPTYMSPEQAQNKGLDRRSDLYSLGCVLYQLAAGRPPYDGENPLSVLLSHVADPIPDLRQSALVPLSEAFVRVIERAMAKNPEDRFANALEMRQALEACRGAPRVGPTRSLRVIADAAMVSPADLDGSTDGYDALSVEPRTAAYKMPSAPGAASSAPPLQGPAAGAPPTSGPPPLAPPQGPAPVHRTPPSGGAATGLYSPTARRDGAAAGPTSGPPAGPAPTSGAAATPATAAPVQDEADPAPAKRSGAVIFAVLAVLLVAGAAIAWLTGGGETATGESQPQAAANAQAGQAAADPGAKPQAAEGAAAAAATAPVAGNGPAAPVAAGGEASAQADAAAAPAGPVDIEVESDPPGATVEVGGVDAGKTPFKVSLSGEGSKTVVLRLDGYADKEISLDRKDAPHAKVTLRKLESDDKVAEPKKAGGKAGGGRAGGKSNGTPKENKSALEERL